MKIIVTAFEPFGGRTTNKSLETINELKGYKTYLLPVCWDHATRMIKQILDIENPDVLVLTGEAGCYDKVKVEVEAHNISNGTDNKGVLKMNEPIDTNSSATLYTKLKFDESIAEISHDAGKYLCNYSYYSALQMMNGNSLFIHFPTNSDENENAKTLMKIISSINII